MADAIFDHPRLAAMYDALEGERVDLDPYLAMVEQFGAGVVLDVGCGTGTFALMLAEQGCQVIGIDPALGSLNVARAKPGAEKVAWIHGDARDLPSVRVDVATMTGNVAQAIVEPALWDATLARLHTALRPGGRLMFETRVPGFAAWREWNRARSYRTIEVAGHGVVDSWVELLQVSGPLVSFRWTWVFAADGSVLTSDSIVRFRDREEIEAGLAEHGFAVEGVRDAPDRPGRELVFVAVRE